MSGIFIPVDASAGSPTFTAAQTRVAFAALMQTGNGRKLGSWSGLHPGSDPTVTVAAPNLTVGICNGWVDPGTATTVGSGFFAFTSNTVLTIPAADNTFTRLDRVDVQVPDDPPSGVRTAEFIYTAGTPSASPALATAPARSTFIGYVTVPLVGGGSPTWNLGLNYAVATGGLLPVPTQAVRDSLTPYKGMAVYRMDTRVVEIYSGTAWEWVAAGYHYGSTTGSATVAINAAANFAMPDTKVQFVVPTTRKVRIYVDYVGSAGAANSQMYAIPAVVAGTTATLTAATLGRSRHLSIGTTGGPGASSVNAEDVFTLAAGTYSAFCAVTCTTGTTSSALTGFCAVYDAGPA